MRASALTVSSLALVATAAVAVVAPARAQEAPIVYRTDPGPAHPRYADPVSLPENAAAMHKVSGERVLGTPAPNMAASSQAAYGVSAYEVSATSYGRDPVYYGASSRGTISVAPGDTVYGIARRYGISPNAIISANRLSAPYKLAIGQALILPDVGSVPMSPTQVSMATSASPSPLPTPSAQRSYVVRQGDTLYSLSRMFGLNVASLASANDLYAPYNLKIDQVLVVPGAADTNVASSTTGPSLPPLPIDEVDRRRSGPQSILVSKNPGARFSWPIRGAVIREYGVSPTGVRHDGINIAAPVGASIRATDDGEVVYTGSELEGYGNLLLVRHDGGWVSAYAHTDSILVRKGEQVRQGQVVAKVGTTGNVDQPQLHFELRHDLQPRDPMQALTGQDRLARASFAE